jgi:hypothetical protein
MSDIQSLPKPTEAPKRRSWRFWLVSMLLVLGTCVALFGFILRPCSPCDTGYARVTDIPEDTVFVCIIADTDRGLVAMRRPSTLFTMQFHHPDRDWVQAEYPHEIHIAVLWIDGKRIGVLRRTKDGSWQVAWFDAAKHPIQRRNRNVSLKDADDVQPVSVEQLRAMGFDKALR